MHDGKRHHAARRPCPVSVEIFAPRRKSRQTQAWVVEMMFSNSNASRPPAACTWLEMPVGLLGPGGSRSSLGPFEFVPDVFGTGVQVLCIQKA